jgi:hypothetical protein
VGEVLLFVFFNVLAVATSATVIRRDMRRLSEAERARSWPDASFWVAVVLFQPLSLPLHFIRTRRSLRGVALGLLWGAGVLVALSLLGELVARIFGLPD